MPGYHGTKVSFHPEYHMLHPRSREMMMGKMAMHQNPTGHPMFDALKNKHAQEKAEYIRMLNRGRRMGGEPVYPTFDSLKLLGAENDANYLDRFMAEGERRPRSSSHSSSKHSSKRNSFNVDNIKKTLIGSLRSVASDENLYETMEVINYRKTIEALTRHNKVRSVPKTGHPLFDHLREENVLKPRRQQQHRHSDGSSSPSSSGSGDEFEYVKKANCRFSRRELLKQQQKHPSKHSTRHVIEEGSESDDDWAIPRPKLCEGARARRTGALMPSLSHEESDSSSPPISRHRGSHSSIKSQCHTTRK